LIKEREKVKAAALHDKGSDKTQSQTVAAIEKAKKDAELAKIKEAQRQAALAEQKRLEEEARKAAEEKAAQEAYLKANPPRKKRVVLALYKDKPQRRR
jgi:hypothetical protein